MTEQQHIYETTPRTREGALQALRTMGFVENGPDPRPEVSRYKNEAFAWAAGGQLLGICRPSPAGPRRWRAQVQVGSPAFQINVTGDAQGVLFCVFEGEVTPEIAIADALLGLQIKLAEWSKALAPHAV